MKVWCSKAADGLWALSGDIHGACLPTELGPWKLHREVELTREATDEREAIELLEVHGFCCFESSRTETRG